jgi:hypothetical protein
MAAEVSNNRVAAHGCLPLPQGKTIRPGMRFQQGGRSGWKIQEYRKEISFFVTD